MKIFKSQTKNLEIDTSNKPLCHFTSMGLKCKRTNPKHKDEHSHNPKSYNGQISSKADSMREYRQNLDMFHVVLNHSSSFTPFEHTVTSTTCAFLTSRENGELNVVLLRDSKTRGLFFPIRDIQQCESLEGCAVRTGCDFFGIDVFSDDFTTILKTVAQPDAYGFHNVTFIWMSSSNRGSTWFEEIKPNHECSEIVCISINSFRENVLTKPEMFNDANYMGQFLTQLETLF